MNLKDYVVSIPDFPKEGILFRDVSPILADGKAYAYATQQLAEYAMQKQADIIVGPEARGFLVGCPVANQLGIGFVPVRKKGKLPGETVEVSYELEYGQATLQMQKSAIKSGQRVVICDDLLATGGTIKATIDLIEALGGEVVGIAFYIELEALKGKDKFIDYDVKSLMVY